MAHFRCTSIVLVINEINKHQLKTIFINIQHNPKLHRCLFLAGAAPDDDGESTGESEGMDTDEEHLAPPGEEDEEETPPDG